MRSRDGGAEGGRGGGAHSLNSIACESLVDGSLGMSDRIEYSHILENIPKNIEGFERI